MSLSLHAASLGEVRGVVHDGQHRPIAEARIELKAKDADWSRTTITSAVGEFAFGAVPLGDYALTIAHPGFAASVLAITVVSGAAPSTPRRQYQRAEALRRRSVTEWSSALITSAASFVPTTLLSSRRRHRSQGDEETDQPSRPCVMIPDFEARRRASCNDQLHGARRSSE